MGDWLLWRNLETDHLVISRISHECALKTGADHFWGHFGNVITRTLKEMEKWRELKEIQTQRHIYAKRPFFKILKKEARLYPNYIFESKLNYEGFFAIKSDCQHKIKYPHTIKHLPEFLNKSATDMTTSTFILNVSSNSGIDMTDEFSTTFIPTAYNSFLSPGTGTSSNFPNFLYIPFSDQLSNLSRFLCDKYGHGSRKDITTKVLLVIPSLNGSKGFCLTLDELFVIPAFYVLPSMNLRVFVFHNYNDTVKSIQGLLYHFVEKNCTEGILYAMRNGANPIANNMRAYMIAYYSQFYELASDMRHYRCALRDYRIVSREDYF